MSEQYQSVQERYASDLLTIGQATERFFGPTVSHFSLRRWIARGVGNPAVKLRAIRIGGRYFLRPCDVDEFIQAQADPELYRRRQKTKRVEKAKRRLRAGA